MKKEVKVDNEIKTWQVNDYFYMGVTIYYIVKQSKWFKFNSLFIIEELM